MSLFSAIKLIPPGSIGFLVICIVAALGLMAFGRSMRRPMRIWLGLLFLTYLILAIPRVANALAALLPSVRQADLKVEGLIDGIIVLDGDNRRGRVRTTGELEAAQSPPPAILVLADAGDPWVVNNLVASGIPAGRITSETGGETTKSQMEAAKTATASRSWSRVAFVASRLQAPRVSGLTRGWNPSPAIVSAPVDDEPPRDGVWAFVPSYIALRVSRDAIYEHLALVYYRWRGWI